MTNGFSKNLKTKTRLLLLGSFFVILPILALSYFQFSSLVELENKTKDAYTENLRHTLSGIDKKIGDHFYRVFSEIVEPYREADFSSDFNQNKLTEHFSKIKESYPEIDEIFFINTCHCEVPTADFAYFYSKDLKRVSTKTDNTPNYHNLIHYFDSARLRKPSLGKKDLFLHLQQEKGKLKQPRTYIFHSFIKKKSKKRTFIGASYNEPYLRKTLLKKLTDEALLDPNSSISSSNIVVQILDQEGKTVYSNSEGEQTYLFQSRFTAPFSKWTTAIGFEDTNVESVARANFWKNLLITTSVLAFLVLGLTLTIKATNREIQLAQAKSDFVSNISHELKTPLSLIRLFVEMLDLGYVKSKENVHEYYQIINDETNRLSHLIDNILDFSNIESGRRVYEFSRENLGELVSDVVSKYQYHIEKGGFDLKLDIEEEIPEIVIDRDAITQSLINLIDNAIKYSPNKKEISIAVKNKATHLLIEVRDRGIGIAKNDKEKIFDDFYRVTDGLKHDIKGSGLGLALVKHIVEAHKGEIFVESELGKGSLFVIQLPFKTENKKTLLSPTERGYEIAENTNS